jgi:hypothetical protein
MVQFIAGDYSRPVPPPTEVSSAICTRCHARERFTEDRLHIQRMFSDKEKAVDAMKRRARPGVSSPRERRVAWPRRRAPALAHWQEAQGFRPESGVQSCRGFS